MTNLIDLDLERLRRMPVVFVGYVTEKQAQDSNR
jgi:hypothetical protein